MSGRVLIVGQGLAGTALGVELEEAGVDFVIASAGHAEAASRVAAGLVNPVTGRRWVKSARVDELLPAARDRYARWSGTLGVELWHPLRLTRAWRDAEERARVEAKITRGELAPYIAAVGARGVELAGAAWVDLPALLGAAEARWQAQGRWRAARITADELVEREGGAEWRGERFAAVVVCVGFGALGRELFAGVPFALAKGEMLTVRGSPLEDGIAVSRGVWVIGGAAGTARVGATYEREREDLATTAEARTSLLAEAGALVGAELTATGQSAGVRLTLPDRLPLAGRHPQRGWLGFFGALGSKGTLWAPALARAWREAIVRCADVFPPETGLGRFAVR